MDKDKLEPVRLVENEAGDRVLIYQGAKGTRIELRYDGDTLWLSQTQMSELFGVLPATISYHLKNIFTEGELTADSSIKESLSQAADKRIRPINLYNLDAIISVGYRVSSAQGTAFRRWATGVLVQFALKGFVVDTPRLKAPGAQDRVAELRDIIRDIRAAEANMYAELRRICSMCEDYDPKSNAAREFYTRMQAKLYWAVTTQTPSMLLVERADGEAPNMGLQAWEKDEIRKADAVVAKNYLGEGEISELNRLTGILLDIFEDQLEIGRLVRMADAGRLLDEQLANLNRAVLRSGGRVSHDDALDHVAAEYQKFDARRRELRAQKVQEELATLRSLDRALPAPAKRRAPRKKKGD